MNARESLSMIPRNVTIYKTVIHHPRTIDYSVMKKTGFVRRIPPFMNAMTKQKWESE